MPYSPNVQSQAGQFYAQGLSSLGQGIAGGIKQYQQNKKQDAAITGIIEAFGQPKIQALSTTMTPENQKLVEKFMTGKANLNEKTTLAGVLQGAAKIDEDKQQADFRAQQLKIGELKLAEAAQEQAQAERLRYIGQFQNGAGSGVLQPQVQERMQAQHADPVMKFAMQTQNATGKAPTTSDVRHFLDTQTQMQGGGTPTTAMRDTDAIIQAELSSGKLKRENLASRRAELLSAGGRDPGDIYDNVGTFVDIETGANARPAVKSRRGENAGQIGFVDSKGAFTPLDSAKWKPSTVGDTNALLDPPGMEKLREKVLADERSVRNIERYIAGFENLDQGATQAVDRITKNLKTLFTKEPLTEDEKATGLQKGRLQQIIGGLRTTIVGPGVMTEQDAERIINAVGGDVDSTQNQEIAKSLIKEILAEKMAEYESNLDVYNTHVVRKYGGQAGYKQRPKVEVQFKKPTASSLAQDPKPMTADELAAKWLKSK